jgi:hypothetical protein
MRFRSSIVVMVLATGVICGAAAVVASPTGDAKPEGTAAAPTAAPTEEPKLPPKQMTEVGTVPWKQAELKPEHVILKGLVGRFTTKVHLYAGPYPRKLDTDGTAEGKVLMGGPFVQLTHSETRMKQPFEAMAIYGFDQATGKYTAAAIDNTSTAIVHFVGTYDAAKKQLVMSGRFSDQQSRILTIVRTVLTFVDETTWTYDEYKSHSLGGPETQMVTITFKRS